LGIGRVYSVLAALSFFGLIFGAILTAILFSNFPSSVYGAPPPSEVYQKHKDYVDSIKSLKEKPSIVEQMRNEIPAHSVMCNNDFVLLLKWTSNRSACVSPQTAEKLVERNWGVYANDAGVLNYSDDPYQFFVGAAASISFEYDDDQTKHYETELIKKVREKLTEHYKELGFTHDYTWAYITIDGSDGQFTLRIFGGMNEDTLRSVLGKIDGVSNIENYGQPYA